MRGMAYSERERISHVARRLGFGVEPEILATATSTDEAIAAAVDLTTPTPVPTDLVPPIDTDDARSPEQRQAPYRYWLTQMVTGPRRIEERLTWFWHDHFATSIRKVAIPYLMYRQHVTLRMHATGSFSDLLGAIAVDPAMLVYLDGVQNQRGAINENFGREVMELFTMGVGTYTEDDVLAASAAFSGWVVARPGGRAERLGVEPWEATFVPFRHDASTKTLLGSTGPLGADDAVGILLDQPETAEYVGAKLYTDLVGLRPDDATRSRVAASFRADYSIMALVEAIVDDPAFVSDAAIRSKVRTPLERAIGIAQALPARPDGPRGSRAVRTLQQLGHAPFDPPNVAGYPSGTRLLGPFDLVHGFDLAWLLPDPMPTMTSTELMAALGLHDVSGETVAVLDAAGDPSERAALAVNAPEFLLT